MELAKISSFMRKSPILFEYLKEYMFYRLTCISKKKLIKKIKSILSIVVPLRQIKKIVNEFPEIKNKLNEDALFAYKNDPSFRSIEEAVVTSPGLYAIMIYRIANCLYQNDVKIVPRLLSEYAHSKTGIDINPEAEIGRNFFIDHGTGIVIGATTFIGDNVKLYHGVTLGAKSLKSAEELRNIKRHPTILNDVTIYSNSTILGGKTIIGEGCVIGANKLITESVPSNTKVI